MALEAKNVYFRYDKKQSWILEDCTLKVEKGECLAVSAPSGYGKTTLAMLLSGYLKPVKGQILLDLCRKRVYALCNSFINTLRKQLIRGGG